jgi:hypothetical protein
MGSERVYKPEAVEAYSRGLDAFLSGDHAGATRMAQTALEIDPGMIEAERMIARLAPRVAVKKDPVAMVIYGKGLDAYFAGDKGGAAKYAGIALKRSPGLVEAQRLEARTRGQNVVDPLRKAVKVFKGTRFK